MTLAWPSAKQPPGSAAVDTLQVFMKDFSKRHVDVKS